MRVVDRKGYVIEKDGIQDEILKKLYMTKAGRAVLSVFLPEWNLAVEN